MWNAGRCHAPRASPLCSHRVPGARAPACEQVYGWEYFGTFNRALFTLFQVLTGDSWSEAVARPIMFGLYQNAIFASIYYVFFILLMQIVCGHEGHTTQCLWSHCIECRECTR